jgi:hypothetical protein
VRDHHGPIDTFNQAWQAQRKVWVLCMDCGHTSLLDPRDILGKSADIGDLSFDKVRWRLRLTCRRCGHRRVGFLPHDEPWSSMR